MQQPEGLLAGPSSHGTAISPPRATKSAPPGFLKPILCNGKLNCGFQTRGGRMGIMLAARAASSLALSYGRAAFLPALPRPAAFSAAHFSTQPSSVPKPGFAPGAPRATQPPPPGTSPSAPPSSSSAAAATAAPLEAPTNAVAAAAATKPTSSSPPAPGPRAPPGSGSGSNGGAAGAGAGTAVVPSRSSRLGWAIPIIGLPLIAAFYNYQKDYDKEWDRKVEKLMQEFMAERRPQTPRPAGVPPALPAAPAASLPPPAPAVVEASKAPVSEPDIKPAQPSPAPPPPPPPSPPVEAAAPAPEVLSAPAEAALQPQGPAAPSDTEAAGAILSATEAAQAAAPPPPVDAAVPVPDEAPTAATAVPKAMEKPAAPAPALSPEAAAATATAAALAILQTDAVPSAPLPSGLPPGKLGLEGKDLSPLGLIQHAVTSAGAQVADWSQWPERYAQAAADSRLIFETLTAAAKWHDAQMAEVRGELTVAVQRSEQLQSAGEAAVQRFKELLKQVVESSKEMLELEVRQAEKRTRLEAEKARLADAVQRGEKLEKLRLAVGALSMAHEARVRQAAASQTG
ncbi:hypothetical protein Vretifemale_9315, partial [Volvox reticuliferus]